MSERNGPDIAAVHQLLTEVARMVTAHGHKLEEHDRRFDQIDRRLDTQDSKINEIIGSVNAHSRVLDEITAVLDRHEKKLDDFAASFASMRETVALYHSAVLGHGITITDLDERVKRLEKFLEEASARR